MPSHAKSLRWRLANIHSSVRVHDTSPIAVIAAMLELMTRRLARDRQMRVDVNTQVLRRLFQGDQRAREFMLTHHIDLYVVIAMILLRLDLRSYVIV
jgi:hypothetical protein